MNTHRHYNQAGNLIWVLVATVIFALLLIGAEVLWQNHQRNKQLKQGRALRRRERANDMKIFQVAEEARSDFR